MLEKRLKILLREREAVSKLMLLPEPAKKLIMRQYDNEIDLIMKGARENDELECDKVG